MFFPFWMLSQTLERRTTTLTTNRFMMTSSLILSTFSFAHRVRKTSPQGAEGIPPSLHHLYFRPQPITKTPADTFNPTAPEGYLFIPPQPQPETQAQPPPVSTPASKSASDHLPRTGGNHHRHATPCTISSSLIGPYPFSG